MLKRRKGGFNERDFGSGRWRNSFEWINGNSFLVFMVLCQLSRSGKGIFLQKRVIWPGNRFLFVLLGFSGT